MNERRNHPSQMAWMQPEEEPTGTQLRLLPGGSRRRDWELDERTRELGRRGVAEAREVLRRVQPKEAPAARKAS